MEKPESGIRNRSRKWNRNRNRNLNWDWVKLGSTETRGAYHFTEKSGWGVESKMVSDLAVYRGKCRKYHIRYGLNPKKGRICVAWVWNWEGTEKLVNGKQHSVWFVPTGMNGPPQNVLLRISPCCSAADSSINSMHNNLTFSYVPGADPGFFSEGGALVSCSTSTPINHIVFFFAEYQLY